MPIDQASDLGRFEEPSLLVLVSLSNGPKHGYAIQTDVRSFANVNLGPGTLYAVLPRLERMGLIEALATDDRRRPYRITGLGATALRAELSRVQGIAAAGLARLGAKS
jgi:DNA-binding PadR family transcriptional regulator